MGQRNKLAKAIRMRKVWHPEKKEWKVHVDFNNGTEWIPALHELGGICREIGKIEDEKYRNGEGMPYMMKYLIEAMEGKNLRELAKRYQFKYADNTRMPWE